MASINRVILLGHAGRDPELRYTPDGSPIANLSIATSRTWKDKNGEKKEDTEWHKLVFYNRLAEVVGEYVKKGSQIYVEGRLKTRKWQDRDGTDRYTTEVIVENMQMIGGNRDSAGQAAPKGATANQYRAARNGSAPPPSGGAPNFSDMDDDIPF